MAFICAICNKTFEKGNKSTYCIGTIVELPLTPWQNPHTKDTVFIVVPSKPTPKSPARDPANFASGEKRDAIPDFPAVPHVSSLAESANMTVYHSKTPS